MAEAVTEVAEAKVTPAPSGASLKQLILIGVLCLLLGLGGAIAYFKFIDRQQNNRSSAEAQAAGADTKAGERHNAGAPQVPVVGKIVDLDPFIVNLADTSEMRYLKLSLKLEMERPDAAEEIAMRLPRIRDAIVILLSSKESSSLRGAQGKFQLRDEIVLRVNAVLPNGGVRTAYFTDFVIQ